LEFIQFFIDLFLNLDTVLAEWVTLYGPWIYLMLFAIIFCETGLVVMAVLPGDSLLFTAGALAAIVGANGEPVLNIWFLLGLLFVAAVLGDGTNYLIGRRFGQGILDSGRFSKIITPQRIDDTNAFFARHGGKTISLARFFPFIRTFAPFFAGIGGMDWGRFTFFNITGGAAWVGLFLGGEPRVPGDRHHRGVGCAHLHPLAEREVQEGCSRGRVGRRVGRRGARRVGRNRVARTVARRAGAGYTVRPRASASSGFGRRHVANLVRSGRKQP